MIRVFSRGFSALALVLIGVTVASAYPIQNNLATNSSHTGNNPLGSLTNVNLSGSTISGLISTNVSAGGFTSRATSVNNSDGGYGAYTGTTLFNGGENFRTYCIELTGGLGGSGNPTTTFITKLPNVLPAPSGWVAPVAGAVERAAWIAYTYGMGATATSSVQAAVQLAIWEVMYDLGLSGSAGANWNTAGNFHVSTNNTILALAKSYLDASVNKRGSGYVLHRGVVFNSPSDLSNDQTLLYATGDEPSIDVNPVPEPSTLAIAGLSGLALLGYGIRRRKRA